MIETDMLASEITLRYGTIQRARECFLYTKKGIRLTDLYQEGGRAILGWGGGSAFTVFKNVLNRGVTGSFDTEFTSRVTKAVEELLASRRSIHIYTNKQRALKAAIAIYPESTSFWRPWNQGTIDWSSIQAVIVEPPLPWTKSVFIVAFNNGDKEKELLLESVPDSERIPAPLAAAVSRSIYDMIAALQTREEKNWFIYDTVVTKYWNRRGPYLYPKVPRERYGDFLLHCLDCELVISPEYDVPSIVPFGADTGVFRKLKNMPFDAE